MDDDRRAYLGHLKDKSLRDGLGVLGYCLMTNHLHLIAAPSSEASLALPPQSRFRRRPAHSAKHFP